VSVGRLAIVGTGLMGTSVGLAAQKVGGWAVTGWDPDPGALAGATERGAIDQAAASLAEAVADAELALVAAPVAHLATQVAAVLAASPEECTVTDVGSTKHAVAEAVGASPRFVGGHPMAGSENEGPAHARAELFEGVTWFLTPSASTDADRYRKVHGFVSGLGAVPVGVDPQTHDRLLALTSHLPHALANLLLNQVGANRIEGYEPLAAAGGALRDMSRIAGANPRVWLDIFLDNADVLRQALSEHRRRVEQLEAALAAEDAGFLARWIGEARANRRELLAGAYTGSGPVQRLLVRVPDRPGMFAAVTQALGAARINIEDFAFRHESPERGGLLTLLVVGEEQARRAAELLESQGYVVDVSTEADEDR
jgi:prephenate dehydrogenase